MSFGWSFDGRKYEESKAKATPISVRRSSNLMLWSKLMNKSVLLAAINSIPIETMITSIAGVKLVLVQK